MKKIIVFIVSIVASIAVGFAAVYAYEKGLKAIKAEITTRWARVKNGLIAWFRTSKPETT